MHKVVSLLGLGQLAFGVMIIAAAPTSIHEILGAVVFGFGSVCLGLGEIGFRVDRQTFLEEKRHAPPPAPKPAPLKNGWGLRGWKSAPFKDSRTEPTL